MDFLKENNKMQYLVKRILFVCLLTTLFSCGKHKEKYHNVMERIEVKSKNYKEPAVTSNPYITEIKTVEITEGKHTFLIPERKSQIESYKCTECHTKSIAELKGSKSGKKAHWDISLKHANEHTMNCVTCHDDKNMDNLTSLTHTSIDFNKSYKVCSQCHSKQFNDWKGGAHGKRLKSWASPRLSNTCVNCHNPHKPSFESRYPSRFNTVYEKERK